jgi:YHS domain-containing protein
MLSKNFGTSKIHAITFITCLSILSFLASCNQNPDKATSAVNSSEIMKTDTLKPKFTAAMVDNKKDPNCGMPVTAGIADTVHYNGKVYGFCSDECKQAFLKNPVVLAKNADLK